MVKAILVGILVVHGSIHALGFVKAFGLAEVAQLAQPISRPWGLLWAVCTLLFLGAAIARTTNAPWWWILGVPAVFLSQIAIVAFWSDAKFGTLVNLALVLPLLVGFGGWRFMAAVDSDLTELAIGGTTESRRDAVNDSDLDRLPSVVATWLRRSGVLGRPRARTIRLSQRGEMMKSPGEDWMSFDAEQWFSVPEPGFVWTVDVDGGLTMKLRGRDRLLNGKGSMRIELFSLVPVARASGPTIDQGALVRFLAEMMWFPSAALEPYMHWEATGPRSARATLRVGDMEVSGSFRFGENGDVTGFEAKRYRDKKLEDWIIENEPSSVRELGGVRIPTRSTVTWSSSEGERWTWLRIEVTALERDVALKL